MTGIRKIFDVRIVQSSMKNKFKICFCSIDVEGDFGKNESFEGIDNLEKILDIFKKHNISATLFVTGNVLENYIENVRGWGNYYEIACHSYSHRFWDSLDEKERREELEKFINLYQKIFNKNPIGFRAPSHIIDDEGLKLLEEKGFLYDSSILPHYPFFKKYRGYKKKAPLLPYWQNIVNSHGPICIPERSPKGEARLGCSHAKVLEIPVTGQIFGIPLVGTWISKLPFFVYKFLFKIKNPDFLTFNLHSWDSLNFKLLEKIEKILKLLKDKNYQFLNGEQIYEQISKNRR